MTLKELTRENKLLGTRAKHFSPFRKDFISLDDLKKFLGNNFDEEIKQAFKIAKSEGIMSLSKQNKFQDLGFSLSFRGFNSHSGDCYVYQDENKDWFISFGMSNIKNAGRGYERELNVN